MKGGTRIQTTTGASPPETCSAKTGELESDDAEGIDSIICSIPEWESSPDRYKTKSIKFKWSISRHLGMQFKFQAAK